MINKNGYWRNQAYGPGLRFRRRQWVGVNTKGRYSSWLPSDGGLGCAQAVVTATIGRINDALEDDANALVVTRGGEVNPSAAYIELVRELLSLLDS